MLINIMYFWLGLDCETDIPTSCGTQIVPLRSLLISNQDKLNRYPISNQTFKILFNPYMFRSNHVILFCDMFHCNAFIYIDALIIQISSASLYKLGLVSF